MLELFVYEVLHNTRTDDELCFCLEAIDRELDRFWRSLHIRLPAKLRKQLVAKLREACFRVVTSDVE